MGIALRQATQAPTAELAEGRNSDRDENQKAVDGMVKTMVAQWNATGQPAPGPGVEPVFAFGVTKTERTAGKEMIRRAFRFVNHEYDSNAAGKAEPSWYKDTEPDTDGIITCAFGVRKLTVKTQAADAVAEGTDAGQQPAEGEQDGEQDGEQSRRRR